ncbi:hypothetical protein ACP4OV_005642 [Aristida adscensionis]
MAVSFTSCRRKLELVTPAQVTPHEYKVVSDIDDQRGLRFYPAGVEFFRSRRPPHAPSSSQGAAIDDPVGVIRAALAEALVSYYPLAGRLLELPAGGGGGGGGKLVVDCTAEGVAFVEADASVRLQDLGQPLIPPYPCLHELLLCDVHESGEGDVVGKPLLFVQVTRFRDNDGFAIGYRYCHNVIDGFGMSRFLDDVFTLARGEALTQHPVWERELLTARAAPRVTHEHPAYERLPGTGAGAEDDAMRATPLQGMVSRYFRLGPEDIAAMRSHVPAGLLEAATVFEVVAAAAWRCRAAALGYGPRQRVRLVIVSNARGRWKKPRSPLPRGFYGNALVLRTAEATVEELCGGGGGLGHALGLVRQSRFDVTDEYMQSMLDLLVQRGRPLYAVDWTYLIADTTSLRRRVAKAIDGWERAAGGGVASADAERVFPYCLQSFYDYESTGGGGQASAVLLSMCLPPPAMDMFATQIAAFTDKTRLASAL